MREFVVGVMFHNNEDLVEPFFYFLRKSEPGGVRVIAVDNGSTDGTAKNVLGALWKGDVFVESKVNNGIAYGRNLIVKEMAKQYGKYIDVVLMDSDIFVARELSISNMVNRLSDVKCGIAYGSVRSFYNPLDVRYGMCFCAIKGEVLEKVGVFDEQFFMFYDDTDFCERMFKLGWEDKDIARLCDHDSYSIHLWGQTTREQVKRQKRREILNSDKEKFEKLHNKKMKDME